MFLNAFSIYLRPKVIAIFFLGFSSGLPLALTASTLSIWLTEAGVDKTTIGLFAIVATPYALKFLWAPLIDMFPLPYFTRIFGRRSGWMILAQLMLVNFTILLGFTDPWQHPWQTAILAFCLSFASATQDIIIDAYRVEILDKDEQGAGAAMIVFGYRVGMLISGAGALFLAEYYSWSVVYFLMALCVTVGIITILFAGEPEILRPSAVKLKHEKAIEWLRRIIISPFADFTHRHGWLLILLFVIFFKFGDALAGVMTNTFFIEVGFSKADIATIIKLYGFAATLAGSFIGGVLVYRLGLVKSLWIGGTFQMLSNLLFALQAVVGYDKELLAITIGFENFSSGIGTAAFVAYLSSLCNISYTATQYALLSSLSSIGRTWLSASAGYLSVQLDWTYFFILTTFAAIPGLIFLSMLTRYIPLTVAGRRRD